MEMKRIGITLLCMGAALAAGISCTNLDEELYDVISQDNFGKTPEEMNSLIGPAYSSMCEYVDGYYWYGMCACDDFIIPSRGYDWNSGGIYRHTHEHTFTALEANSVYNFWRFSAITNINKVLDMVENTTSEIADRERVIAELKGLRAWWYFFMLDRIGAVPIVTKWGEEMPSNEGLTRKDVYDFVVGELESVVEDLNEEVGPSTYTKFTKWVGYTLLAKLYLNAEVYSGTPNWEKALECCNKVIDSKKYILEPDNNTNFLVHNEGSRENIFVIPYDYEHFKCYFIPYQMSFHYNHTETFNIRFDGGCWNGPCFTPSFMKSYDPDDKRLGWFLYGQQYDRNGKELKDRKGNLLNFTFDMKDYADATEYEGARIFKWELEEDSFNHLNNDFAVFRYVDVLLMKAECLLRTGKTGEATDIVNECRKRNFAKYDASKQIKELTLDELLAERGRELVVEGWRRNDLIRFGKYTEPFDFKPTKDNADNHTLLFPIPQQEIDKNPGLVQNPGY
ncbi:MAG: RagB/SusD family nutrient uptake outer membrane protein [Bacteroidales bacterium]|nr:RagB/SusD family nutrient uptake outer membrane protein [Bacteroidales bacterium]